MSALRSRSGFLHHVFTSPNWFSRHSLEAFAQATVTKPQLSKDGGGRLVLSCVGRAAAIRTRDSSCPSACLAHSVKTSAHWGAILTVAYGMNEFRSSKCLVCLCFWLLCVRYADSVLWTYRAQSHDPIMGGRL